MVSGLEFVCCSIVLTLSRSYVIYVSDYSSFLVSFLDLVHMTESRRPQYYQNAPYSVFSHFYIPSPDQPSVFVSAQLHPTPNLSLSQGSLFVISDVPKQR